VLVPWTVRPAQEVVGALRRGAAAQLPAAIEASHRLADRRALRSIADAKFSPRRSTLKDTAARTVCQTKDFTKRSMRRAQEAGTVRSRATVQELGAAIKATPSHLTPGAKSG
jgi:hypothetical protein